MDRKPKQDKTEIKLKKDAKIKPVRRGKIARRTEKKKNKKQKKKEKTIIQTKKPACPINLTRSCPVFTTPILRFTPPPLPRGSMATACATVGGCRLASRRIKAPARRPQSISVRSAIVLQCRPIFHFHTHLSMLVDLPLGLLLLLGAPVDQGCVSAVRSSRPPRSR